MRWSVFALTGLLACKQAPPSSALAAEVRCAWEDGLTMRYDITTVIPMPDQPGATSSMSTLSILTLLDSGEPGRLRWESATVTSDAERAKMPAEMRVIIDALDAIGRQIPVPEFSTSNRQLTGLANSDELIEWSAPAIDTHLASMAGTLSPQIQQVLRQHLATLHTPQVLEDRMMSPIAPLLNVVCPDISSTTLTYEAVMPNVFDPSEPIPVTGSVQVTPSAPGLVSVRIEQIAEPASILRLTEKLTDIMAQQLGTTISEMPPDPVQVELGTVLELEVRTADGWPQRGSATNTARVDMMGYVRDEGSTHHYTRLD